jgi:UDP-N-acetylglucosamine 2-epimerase (non-hydrolysing)
VKVVTLLGTRPEIIRLSLIIKTLDRFCEHTVVHTGQNYEATLSDVFFKELDLRPPDRYLGVRASGFAEQGAQIISRSDEVLAELAPDRLVILGDTNSGLAAIAAARRGIPVYHLEAGNRAYDDRVPEEVNRRIIDHCSSVLMPYTHRSKENLLREGIERQRIFVIGNPIFEVLRASEDKVSKSGILARLGVSAGTYFAATLHRSENVDDPDHLAMLFDALTGVASHYAQPVIVSVHPRTRDRMTRSNLKVDAARLRILEPLGFHDFVALEKNARCVLSDSGTVQEECAIYRVPSVTIRDVTERAETIESGSAMLSGAAPADVLRAVDVALGTTKDWSPPAEYVANNVSATVAKIVLGHLHRTW